MAARPALTALVLVTALVASGAGSGEAAAQAEPDCRASTALGQRAGVIRYRIRCNFEVTDLGLRVDRRVFRAQRRPEIRNADPEDGMRCRRNRPRSIRCGGRAGARTTILGDVAVRGDRCGVDVRFAVSGGVDCDDPDFGCLDVAFAANLRDERPSGCVSFAG